MAYAFYPREQTQIPEENFNTKYPQLKRANYSTKYRCRNVDAYPDQGRFCCLVMIDGALTKSQRQAWLSLMMLFNPDRVAGMS